MVRPPVARSTQQNQHTIAPAFFVFNRRFCPRSIHPKPTHTTSVSPTPYFFAAAAADLLSSCHTDLLSHSPFSLIWCRAPPHTCSPCRCGTGSACCCWVRVRDAFAGVPPTTSRRAVVVPFRVGRPGRKAVDPSSTARRRLDFLRSGGRTKSLSLLLLCLIWFCFCADLIYFHGRFELLACTQSFPLFR